MGVIMALINDLSVDRSLRDNDVSDGAGEGNRTLVVSLEGFCSTIELHPPAAPAAMPLRDKARQPTH